MDQTNFSGDEAQPASASSQEPQTNSTEPKTQKSQPKKESFMEALKQVETIGMAVGDALQGRNNVVMVRITDDALAYLDMLVEADMAKSRSESAAYLINEGIKSNQDLFMRIKEVTEKIESLKAQLREVVKTDKGQ
jgi:hypothetical protein